MIDEKTCCVAQAKLDFAKRQTRPEKSKSNLFTSLAVCGHGGKFHLLAHTSNKGEGRSRKLCDVASFCGVGTPHKK